MLKVTRCEFVHNLPCEQVSGRLTELEAENAKLRELVQTYYEALRHGAEPAEWVTDDVQDLRELGVEVDA